MRALLRITNPRANLREFPLKGETVIGRSADCQLRIASKEVSRRHCRITMTESAVFVEDLGSANGTLIDGTPSPAGQQQAVLPGSVLGIGPASFIVEYTVSGRPPKPVAAAPSPGPTSIPNVAPLPPEKSSSAELTDDFPDNAIVPMAFESGDLSEARLDELAGINTSQVADSAMLAKKAAPWSVESVADEAASVEEWADPMVEFVELTDGENPAESAGCEEEFAEPVSDDVEQTVGEAHAVKAPAALQALMPDAFEFDPFAESTGVVVESEAPSNDAAATTSPEVDEPAGDPWDQFLRSLPG